MASDEPKVQAYLTAPLEWDGSNWITWQVSMLNAIQKMNLAYTLHEGFSDYPISRNGVIPDDMPFRKADIYAYRIARKYEKELGVKLVYDAPIVVIPEGTTKGDGKKEAETKRHARGKKKDAEEEVVAVDRPFQRIERGP